jgi:hypothetical protein
MNENAKTYQEGKIYGEKRGRGSDAVIKTRNFI